MVYVRKLYDWVLHWAHTKYGIPALFILAFCESSFFPIPPDILLMALSMSRPQRSFLFALVCSMGSVLGGSFGYWIGREMIETVGRPILKFYGATERYNEIGELYNRYDAWAVGIAGFTPIPYKVFTIAAGAFEISFAVFMLASLVSRSARFFIIAGLLYKFGPPVKSFIEKYFNLLSIVFVSLLIGGFVAFGYLFR